ncbi:ferredoxin [Desulfuromusa kysingii]|uniref:Ferredoxin n=1 Tax=Desulfuromusa kysingii TaxID=37625 RepID=A0A1H4DPK9_9BACT|nr:ferredoxin [Desulfuromusa kysingii]SEA74695.1 ferredoxin [Desulfuromusa kysingii]
MAKTAFVDTDECIGCELCATNCPGAFRMNDDGKAECYDSSGASEEEIQSEAIDVCPVGCIHWQD